MDQTRETKGKRKKESPELLEVPGKFGCGDRI